MNYPKTFTDALGRSWTINITVGTLPRLKSVAGLSLDDIVPKRLAKNDHDLMPLADFMSDPIAILQATYAVCKPQIDKAGLTFDQFAEGFEGDGAVSCCERMGEALLQAIHDFFLHGAPIKSPLRAAMVARALSLGQKITAAEASRAERVFDRIEDRITKNLDEPLSDSAIDDALNEASKRFAGNTPALSTLTPAS